MAPEATTGVTIRGTDYTFAGADPYGSLSLGNPAVTRTLTNLAAGRLDADSTDGVNGSQLFATNQALNALAVTSGNIPYVSINRPATAAVNFASDGATGENAIAIGVGTTASGQFSTAIGRNNTNNAERGLAIGDSNIVDGAQSQAIGLSNNLAGGANFAAGSSNILTGAFSHAMGVGNDISGSYAYAIGNNNNILGIYSGVFGTSNTISEDATDSYILGNRGTIAAGVANGMALGSDTQVNADNGVALGSSAVADAAIATAGATIRGTNYTFAGATPFGTVSIGSAGNERTLTNLAAGRLNASSTDAVNGSQLFATNQALNALTATSGNIPYVSINRPATAAVNFASDGATGNNAIAIGVGTTASGINSTAIGVDTTASGNYSTAIGYNNAVIEGMGLAIGASNTVDGDQSLAIGLSNRITGGVNFAAGAHNFVNGSFTNILGVDNQIDGFYLHVVGNGNNITARDSGAFGTRNTISEDASDSYIFGNRGTIAAGVANGLALGNDTQVNADNGVALGSSAVADAAIATAGETIRGTNYTFAGATPFGTVSIGSTGNERTLTNLAAGRLNAGSTDAVNGSQLFATNQALNALAANSGNIPYVSINRPATAAVNFASDGATGNNAIAIGVGTTASGNNSTAIGVDTTASGNYSTAIGYNNAVIDGMGLAIGASNTVDGDQSHAIGLNNRITGGVNIAAGAHNIVNGSFTNTLGVDNQIDGYYVHVVGINNNISANFSGAFGTSNTISQDASDSYILGNRGTIAAGVANGLGLGTETQVNADNSVALGSSAVADAAIATAGATLAGTNRNFAGAAPIGTVSLGSQNNERTLTNLAAGRLNADSTDGVNGSQLFATNETLNALSTQAAAGWNLSANGANTTSVSPTSAAGNAINLTNTDTNLVVAKAADSNTVSFNLANDLNIANSITVGSNVINTAGATLNALNVAGGVLTVNNTGGNYTGPITQGTHLVNKQYVDQQATSAANGVNLTFAGNTGGNVTRANGQTLSITGGATTAGTYTGNNLRTVTNPTTGALQLEMAEAPRFGAITINNGGKITGLTAATLSATSTDAVNGSQLFATNQALQTLTAASGKVPYLSIRRTGAAAGNVNSDGATGNNAIAIGPDASATANEAVAVGNAAKATQNATVALGNNAQASERRAIAVGVDAQASGIRSAAFGEGAIASNSNSVALGSNAIASGLRSYSMGNGAQALGQDSIVIGRQAGIGTNANSDNQLAIGSFAGQNVNGGSNIAIGDSSGNTVVGDNNQAFGDNAGRIVNGFNNQAIGTRSGNNVRGSRNIALGWESGNSANGNNNVSLGSFTGTNVNGFFNNAQGYWAGTGVSGNYNVATGNGAGAYVNGHSNVAIGNRAGSKARAIENPLNGQAIELLSETLDVTDTVAIGSEALAAFNNAVAVGSRSLAQDANTTAIGTDSRAREEDSTALGALARSIGLGSTALGSRAEVEGEYSVALGYAADAEGDFALALGANSVSDGNQTIALGAYSTADEADAIAIGHGSRASTANSVALGANSVTETAVGNGSTTLLGTTYNFAGAAPVGTVSIGSAGNERTLTNLAAGRLASDSTDGVNGSQLFATNQALSSISTSVNAGWNLSANGANGTSVSPTSPTGTDVDLTNTDGNLVLSKTDTSNDVSFDLADDLNIANSISVGSNVINTAGATFNTLNVAGGLLTVSNTGANYTGPITEGTHIVNKEYVDQQVTAATGNVSLTFAGNEGEAIVRRGGQTLAITGEATTAGTYTGNNIRTVTDPATGAVQIEMAEAPRFGGVTINDGGTGRITGVAPAILSRTSTHAVNGSQLVALGDTLAAAFGGGTSYDPTTNVLTARIAIGDVVYNNVQDAIRAAMSQGGGNTGTGGSWNLATGAVGSGVVNNSQTTAIANNGTATFVAGNNIVLTQNGAEVQVAVNRNLNNMESISIANGPTINGNGIDMNQTRITNLADGVAPGDAVNVRQLNTGLANTLTQANTYTDEAFARLNGQMGDYRQDAFGGTASAMAMGTLPQAITPGANVIGMGVSTYGGEQAMAVGYSRATTDGRYILKAQGSYDSRSRGGASVGVGIQF